MTLHDNDTIDEKRSPSSDGQHDQKPTVEILSYQRTNDSGDADKQSQSSSPSSDAVGHDGAAKHPAAAGLASRFSQEVDRLGQPSAESHGWLMRLLAKMASADAHHAQHQLDEGARILREAGDIDWDSVTPEEFDRVRRKIDWHLLPLMMLLYFLQFSDKTSLGDSSILGLKTDNHLDTTEYNLLGTVFYIAYLVCVIPQSLLMQRFPVGRVLTCNIFLFGIFLMLHSVCSSFPPLLILRLCLGATEGSVTAGFLIVTSQFYLIEEQAQRVSYWFLMNGTAQIVNALLSYGVQHVNLNGWKPWRIFCIILGSMTVLLSIIYFLFFPANGPGDAPWLTPRERAITVKRIEKNKTGVENKHFKPGQAIEAFKDVKIWLFFFFALLDNMPNSLQNQRALIIKSLGFSTLETALLTIPNGVAEIVTMIAGGWIARKTGAIAWTGFFFFFPSIAACIIIPAVKDQIVRLVFLYLTIVCNTAFVLALSWCSSTTAGHTKKVISNGVLLIGYCVGNLIGNQIWIQPERIPWSICASCYVLTACLLLVIRFVLKRRNAEKAERLRRKGVDPNAVLYNNAASGHDEVVHIPASSASSSAHGQDVENGATGVSSQVQRVNVAFLDLTDRENDEFRYGL